MPSKKFNVSINANEISETSRLLDNPPENTVATAVQAKHQWLGTASKNIASFLLGALGSSSFALNAWNLPTNVTGWLADVLDHFPSTTTSIYLVIATELVGASMGMEAINNYLTSISKIKQDSKQFLIRLGLLFFGISAMLPASLTAYLDLENTDDSNKTLKESMIICSTLIYGMVYANSAYNLHKLKISIKGLRHLQKKLFALANELEQLNQEQLNSKLSQALLASDFATSQYLSQQDLNSLQQNFLDFSKPAQYKVMLAMLGEDTQLLKHQQKLKEALLWSSTLVLAAISTSGGLIPTWLGMEKFYNNVIGSSYLDVSFGTRFASQGIPDFISYLARGGLYTNGIFNTIDSGIDFIKSLINKSLSKTDIAFFINNLALMLLVSLPVSSSSINTAQAGKLLNITAIDDLLDYLVIPVTLITSTALFQVSLNHIASGIRSFFTTYNKPKNTNNQLLATKIRELANDIIEYSKPEQALQTLSLQR